MSMSRWDLSDQWVINDRASTTVKVYGDSLLSETINGRRCWYGIINDSICFEGEEDRLTAIVTDDSVCSFILPLMQSRTISAEFTASGTTGGRKFEVRIQGHNTTKTAGSPRSLILAAGDTIHNATLTLEQRSYVVDFVSDTLSPSRIYTIESYRWYDAEGLQSLLPVAVQKTIYSGFEIDKDTKAISSTCFVRDRLDVDMSKSKLEPDQGDLNSDTDGMRAALSAAEISLNGRMLTVNADIGNYVTEISIDVMDAGGRLYIHEDFETTQGRVPYSIDCRELRSGEYIVAINATSTGEVLTEKRYIKIR